VYALVLKLDIHMLDANGPGLAPTSTGLVGPGVAIQLINGPVRVGPKIQLTGPGFKI